MSTNKYHSRFSDSAVGKYMEFLFKSQYQRKIHPGPFLISMNPLKLYAIAAIAYYFYPEKMSMILSIAGILLARMYIKTRMTYRGVLNRWSQGRDDESIILISKYAENKERYLKNRINIEKGERLG